MSQDSQFIFLPYILVLTQRLYEQH